ncbi:hypothetical protein BC940DRAFT_333539 [Gongronella butleri]|nr:hypothetical protein BC940DRAFT_333539 [Gongronella butleri]
MPLVDLPSELHYEIFRHLPSVDVTRLATIPCLNGVATLLIAERAHRSMKLGWRLIIGTVTRRVRINEDGHEEAYEEDVEFLCEFARADPRTLQLHFAISAIDDDGFCSLVNNAPVQSALNPAPATGDNDGRDDQPPTMRVYLPARSTTTFQVSIIKEEANTKLLAYAMPLPDSFHAMLDMNDDVDTTATHRATLPLGNNVLLHYELAPCPDDKRTQAPLFPIASIHLQNLQVAAAWWWEELQQHHDLTSYFVEHSFW